MQSNKNDLPRGLTKSDGELIRKTVKNSFLTILNSISFFPKNGSWLTATTSLKDAETAILKALEERFEAKYPPSETKLEF